MSIAPTSKLAVTFTMRTAEDNLAKIGTASWELDRVVGLRAPIRTHQALSPQSVSAAERQPKRKVIHSYQCGHPVAACESRVLAEVLIAGENGAMIQSLLDLPSQTLFL